jgi:hypothetical protein
MMRRVRACWRRGTSDRALLGCTVARMLASTSSTLTARVPMQVLVVATAPTEVTSSRRETVTTKATTWSPSERRVMILIWNLTSWAWILR